MIYHILLIHICLFLGMNWTHAQQVPFLSQYLFQPALYNPSLSGAGGLGSISLGHQQQWLGLEGAPITQVLQVGFAPMGDNKLGIGALLTNDKAYVLNRTSLALQGAYHLIDDGTNRFSIGLSVGFINYGADYSGKGFEAETGINQSDPILAQGKLSQMSLDAALGFNYQYATKDLLFRVGVASTQLPKVFMEGDDQPFFNTYGHLMGTVALKFSAGEVAIEPILFYKGVLPGSKGPEPLQESIKQEGGNLDIFARLHFAQQRFWAGLGSDFTSLRFGLGVVFGPDQRTRAFLGGAYQGDLGLSYGLGGTHQWGTSGTTQRKPLWQDGNKLQEQLSKLDPQPDESKVTSSPLERPKVQQLRYTFADETDEYNVVKWAELRALVGLIERQLASVKNNRITGIALSSSLLENDAELTSGADIEYRGDFGGSVSMLYSQGSKQNQTEIINQGSIDKKQQALLKLYSIQKALSEVFDIPVQEIELKLKTDNANMEWLRETLIEIHIKR